MPTEPQTAPTDEAGTTPPPEPLAPPEPPPLLTLRDGLPDITETPDALAEVVRRVAAGTGPVALDAERASGYRYSSRAYLIQLRREGSGSALIDPIAFDDLADLDAAIGDAEWILHAASQDLPCLRELGLEPRALFDTELAARLLGYPRVGLATLVEVIMDRTMRKEHSAVDWSKRPLPTPWLEYAALDVEVLVELRDVLAAELAEQGKERWAAEEFQHLVDHVPAPRAEPWRRTSGIHKAKGRRGLAAVRELWTVRDQIAEQRDTTPGRLIPDAAMIAAANAMPTSRSALLDTPGFHGRGARRFADRWLGALEAARQIPDQQLPPLTMRSDAPPAPRVWAERDPVAAGRLARARDLVSAYAEEHRVPIENLLTPDYLRRVMWKPPVAPDADAATVQTAVAEELRRLGARAWQVEITAPMLAEAVLDPRPATPPSAPDAPVAPAE
ncbi:HRDC domain-containing protein [Nocardioides aurantiacus]|uniref:Ribonuclease D n=1 Tax=Nocardioides aurantiacus TaxID=86796 RepID=A0A3N2CSU4_9ACTN|nr:HRDC domain-containing protein [Nocardioides aurantiacus]ROR90486.1 ribonuclease D [Nocardioides aurantiacus]